MRANRKAKFASTSVLLFLAAVLAFLTETRVVAQVRSPQGKAIKVASGVTVVIPAPWFLADRTKNAVELAYPLQSGSERPRRKAGEKPRSGNDLVTAAAYMTVEVDPDRNHVDALRRLARIASETPERAALVVIAGWPAIERRRTAPLPSPGEAEGPSTGLAVYVTTSVAVDTLIVRFETIVAPDTDPKLADAAFQIARSIRVKPGDAKTAQHELSIVSRSITGPLTHPEPIGPHGPEAPPSKPPTAAPTPPSPGIVFVQGGLGELEIAVSDDGNHVVVAANSGFSFSDDGGQTFASGGGTPCVYTGCDGDPSLAVGKSGNIYYAWIGFPTPLSADGVSISSDNGHTFSFAGNAVVCHANTPPACNLADQPHIAADRASLSASDFDRVYVVWRKFGGAGAGGNIVCSVDGGSTWSQTTTIEGGGDYPRVTVGDDGSVYAVYINGSNINLRKFSSCDNGLIPQPPVTVGTYVGPQACGNSPGPAPLPGLDRCNDGNIINSPTAAVDPVDPRHVYVAWATSTSAINEDVMLSDSMDGGLTFPRSVRVNSALAARRFMPWACSTGGKAFVSWYDRSAATSANNDLTNYFLGGASSTNTGLQPSPEVNLSSNPDPQCASGWPCSTFEVRDATSCSVQPQLAGFCSISGARCSFSAPQCPEPGEQCNGGRGCPKYGDYNGNTCVGSRICTAWASATSPPGLPPANGISIFASCFSLPQPTQLTINKVLLHPDSIHLRLFNLQIDGVSVRTNINAGTTGPQTVNPGLHTVGETGGTGTNLSNFFTEISGDCAANGIVSVGPGESKTCTITNYDNFGGCPARSQCCEPGTGKQGCQRCVALSQQCQ